MANEIRIGIGIDGVPGVQAGAAQAGKAIEGIGKAGEVSAAQAAAAMRTLPAQFTDIVTSLQGGQSPLTVLLQQGGQIKDQFGGVGAAARALGGYVAGLVGPFTLAAAAAGGLAVAYSQGAKEGDAYAKALILTGNAAGTTAGRLQDAAARIDGVVGTQAAAAEALALLAGAANIDPAGLERFASAAIRMERATGVAVADTVKQFSDLGRAPLEAAIKLNEQTNFLTTSVYAQIKALSDVGRVTEAAAVAQEAYADALDQRSGMMEDRLGLIEKSWRGVKDAAKEAWDAMLNVGRADTLQDRLADAQKRLAELQGKNPWKNAGIVEATQAAVGGDDFLRERTAHQKSLIESLRESIRLEGRSATAAADSARQVKARIEFDKTGAQYLTDAVKLEREIAKARTEGAAAGASQLEIDERVAAIREKFKPKSTSRQATDPFAAERDAAKAWADALQDFTRIGASAEATTDGLTRGQARLVEYLGSPAYTNASEGMRELALQEAYAAIASEQMVEARKDAAEALKQVTAEQARYVESLNSSAAGIEAQVQRLQDENEAAALAAAQNITLAQAIERITVARLREAQARALSFGDNDAAAAIQREIDARAQLADALDAKESREAADKFRKDEAAEWAKVWDQVGQSLSDALMDGGKSASEYIKGLFRNMVLRPMIQMAGGGVASMFGAPASAGGVTGGTGASSLGSLGQIAGLIGNAGIGFKAGLSAVFGESGFAGAFDAGKIALQSGNISGGLGTLGGAAAGGLAGIMGGRAIGQGISNGYAVGGGSGNAAVNVGTAIGMAIMGPLGAVVGGAIGGLANRAFGRKLADTGIEGTLGGSAGFSGNAFTLEKGGWLRSDRTTRSQLDADTTTALSSAVDMAKATTKAYATALGLGSKAVDTYTQSIRISLKGLSEDDQAKAIETALAGFAEGLADTLGGGLDALALRGESTGAVLARLAGNLLTVNGTMDSLNVALLSASVSGAEAATKLLAAFGGADQFAAATSSYLEQFYSDAERTNISTRQLTTTLSKLGLALPGTRDSFRRLVESQDLTTDAGRNTYAALLSLSGAFASITEQAEAAVLSTSGLVDEIERLRGGSSGGGTSLAELQAKFATATAQARAGDATALAGLPAISRAIESAAEATARSALDVTTMRAYLASSLSSTVQALNGGTAAAPKQAAGSVVATGALPASVQSSAAGGADALLAEVKALRAELAGLRAEQQIQAATIASNTGKTARLFERVTPDGDAIATRAAA